MSRTGYFALLLAGILAAAPDAEAKPRRAGSASHKKKGKARANRARAARSVRQARDLDPADKTLIEAEAYASTTPRAAAAPLKTATRVAASPLNTTARLGPSQLGQPSEGELLAPTGGGSASKGSPDEPWLEATAAIHLFRRDYSYRDDIFNALPSYRLPLGSAPALAVDLWPLLNVGAFAGYEHAVGLSSAAPCPAGGTCTLGGLVRYPTSSTAFQIGAQYRLPVNAFRFGAQVGYGWRTFGIDDAQTAVKPLIPSVSYRFVLARGTARWKAMPWLAFDVAGGYRYLLSTGELGSSSYFPNQAGAGVDASAGVSYLLPPGAIRLSFDVERHFFKLNPKVGDPLVAGGALDQFMGLRLSGSWSLF